MRGEKEKKENENTEVLSYIIEKTLIKYTQKQKIEIKK